MRRKNESSFAAQMDKLTVAVGQAAALADAFAEWRSAGEDDRREKLLECETYRGARFQLPLKCVYSGALTEMEVARVNVTNELRDLICDLRDSGLLVESEEWRHAAFRRPEGESAPPP